MSKAEIEFTAENAEKLSDLISRSALLEKRFAMRSNFLGKVSVVAVKDVEDAPAVDAVEVVRCENCTHQQKVWHDDKRMKKGGFFIYSCKLNEDPFVTHVVNGNPGEFCCAGKRRTDDAD